MRYCVTFTITMLFLSTYQDKFSSGFNFCELPDLYHLCTLSRVLQMNLGWIDFCEQAAKLQICEFLTTQKFIHEIKAS